MLKKIREYFKGKNPYLVASAGIVIVSVVAVCLILKDEVPAGKETDTIVSSVQESIESGTEDSVSDKEVGQEKETIGIEQAETVAEMQESEPFIESASSQEKMLESKGAEDTAEEAEMVTESEAEVATKPEEIKKPEPVSEPEEIPETVPESEPEPFVEPEPEQDIQPEPAPQLPEETVAPEVAPAPEENPSQEEEALPEETPKPEADSEPEVTPQPQEPEATPQPEVHEHSWIFESYYQEPTCSNGGLVTQVCAHCGESQVTGGTPTGEHRYEVETVGDCCSAEVVACADCNFREVGEKNPKNHVDVEDGFCYGCGQKTE